MRGSARSRPKRSGERIRKVLLGTAAAVTAGLLLAAPARDAMAQLLPYQVEGDGIVAPLTGRVGDPARGRAVVASRQAGLCLLCHAAPIPEERFQGSIGPDLRGVGARLSSAQLRLRLVDSSRVNPDTVMPGYYVVAGRTRVGAAWPRGELRRGAR